MTTYAAGQTFIRETAHGTHQVTISSVGAKGWITCERRFVVAGQVRSTRTERRKRWTFECALLGYELAAPIGRAA